MIPWWAVLAGVVALVALAAWREDEVRVSVWIVLGGVVVLVLSPLVWVFTRMDVGAVRLPARALERFCRMRSADREHPAWVFFLWKRGVIILRKWEIGSDRVKVRKEQADG